MPCNLEVNIQTMTSQILHADYYLQLCVYIFVRACHRQALGEKQRMYCACTGAHACAGYTCLLTLKQIKNVTHMNRKGILSISVF